MLELNGKENILAKLHVCLDLGSDVLKTAFAYKSGNEVVYGKFSKNNLFSQIAIPAVAFYDKQKNNWVYGSEVNKLNGDSYMTVVKIKSLLELVSFKINDSVTTSNQDFYFNKNRFPKFYFPIRRKRFDDFANEVERQRTFSADGYTPEKVVKGFFLYVKNFVYGQAKKLVEEKNTPFEGVEIAIVNPPKIGKAYTAEIKRVVEAAFGQDSVKKVIPSTKAISIYAARSGLWERNESCLVFDMGEEDISVAQTTYTEAHGIILDGVEGHSEPIELGGLDIDEAIYNHIENSIYNRETVGTPSSGEDGHIYEKSVLAKQYLLMQDIKRLKVALSFGGGKFFPNGVPISVHREVIVQRKITADEFKRIIMPVAERISDYIIRELKLPINNGVKKVILSGGLVETYALLNYLINRVAAEGLSHRIITLENSYGSGDDFSILPHEDATYSSAVGGAMISALNIDVKTVLSLSYGTWGGNSSKKLLKIFAERGSILDNDENLFRTKFRLMGNKIEGEEMYSCVATIDELKNDAKSSVGQRKYKNVEYYSESLVVGDKGSYQRNAAQRDISLKVVSGGADSQIKLYFGGVEIIERDFNCDYYFYEGIKVDETGRAIPYIEGADNIGKMRIRCADGREVWADKYDIRIAFANVESFDTVQG